MLINYFSKSFAHPVTVLPAKEGKQITVYFLIRDMWLAAEIFRLYFTIMQDGLPA
jgi:hypothetical protein